MGKPFKSVTVIALMKSFLFFLNIMIFIAGICLLVMGIWAEFELGKYVVLSPEFSGTGPLVFIGVGVFVVLVSSIAFPSIIKGQPVLIYVYGGFLACIFMMEMGIGASIAVHWDSFDKGLQSGLMNTLVHYNPEKDNFNKVQATLKCCGVANYTDWVRLSPQRVIPVSCCIDLHSCVTANYSDVYQKGCYEVLADFMTFEIYTLVAVFAGMAAIPLMGTVVSYCLARYITKHKNVVN